MTGSPINFLPGQPQQGGDKQQLLAQVLMGGLPGALQGKSGMAGLMPSDPLMGMLMGGMGGKKGPF